jgi:heme-degrading monooxygenase HmoA
MMLGHMVYFTLKDNSEEAVQRLIASCKEHLSGHPGTVFFAAGTRVPDLLREVNDKEFHVALQVVFESRQAQDAYQVHERHEKFIETNRDNWTKVRVFDADLS